VPVFPLAPLFRGAPGRPGGLVPVPILRLVAYNVRDTPLEIGARRGIGAQDRHGQREHVVEVDEAPGVEVGVVGAHRRANGLASVGGGALAYLVVRDEPRRVSWRDIEATGGESRSRGLSRLPRRGDLKSSPPQVFPGPTIAQEVQAKAMESPHVHRRRVYVTEVIMQPSGQFARGVARKGQGRDTCRRLSKTVALVGVQVRDAPQERLGLPAPWSGKHEKGTARVGVGRRVLIAIER